MFHPIISSKKFPHLKSWKFGKLREHDGDKEFTIEALIVDKHDSIDLELLLAEIVDSKYVKKVKLIKKDLTLEA